MNFCLIALLILMPCCVHQAEPETHLIPKGYKGSIIITFKDSLGTEAIYYIGKRVYQIPANGILRTNFKKREKGFIADRDLLFYYFDSNGRFPLKVIHEIQNHTIDLNDTSIYVFGFENSNRTIRYLVGKLNDGEKYFQELRKRIDSLFPPQIIQ